MRSAEQAQEKTAIEYPKNTEQSRSQATKRTSLIRLNKIGKLVKSLDVNEVDPVSILENNVMGSNLNELRNHQKLSLRGFCKVLNQNSFKAYPNEISRIERGQGLPSAGLLTILSNVFKIDVAFFFVKRAESGESTQNHSVPSRDMKKLVNLSDLEPIVRHVPYETTVKTIVQPRKALRQLKPKQIPSRRELEKRLIETLAKDHPNLISSSIAAIVLRNSTTPEKIGEEISQIEAGLVRLPRAYPTIKRAVIEYTLVYVKGPPEDHLDALKASQQRRQNALKIGQERRGNANKAETSSNHVPEGIGQSRAEASGPIFKTDSREGELRSLIRPLAGTESRTAQAPPTTMAVRTQKPTMKEKITKFRHSAFWSQTELEYYSRQKFTSTTKATEIAMAIARELKPSVPRMSLEKIFTAVVQNPEDTIGELKEMLLAAYNS